MYFAQGKHKWFFFVCTISYFYMKHLLHQPRLVFFAHVTLDVIRRWGRRDGRKSKRMAAATNFKIFAFDKSFLISCKCNYIPTTKFLLQFLCLCFIDQKYAIWWSWETFVVAVVSFDIVAFCKIIPQLKISDVIDILLSHI